MRRFVYVAILLANCFGIYVYIERASVSWPIPEEAGLDPATVGPALVWVLGALPVIVLFTLVDAVWLYVVKTRKSDRAYVYAAITIWFFAIAFDFFHDW
jgi:hypothetical protein